MYEVQPHVRGTAICTRYICEHPFPVSTAQIIGEFCKNRRSLQYRRYVAATANIIDAVWNPGLIGKARECSPHLQANWGKFVAPIRSFHRFFSFAALRLLEYELQDQQYWRSIRKTKEQTKHGKLFAALCLLLYKQPTNLAVLTRNRNMFNT